MTDCLSNETYTALLTSSSPMSAAQARDIQAQPFCNPNIKIKCDNISNDSLLAVAQCEHSIALGFDVISACAVRAHPHVLAAMAAQCPERAAQLDVLRGQLGPVPEPEGPEPTRSGLGLTGSQWKMAGAVALCGAALGYTITRR